MMGPDILTDGSLTLDNFSGFDPSNAHRSSYRCYRMAMGMPMGAQAGGAVVGNVNVQGPVVVPQAAAAGSPAVSPAALQPVYFQYAPQQQYAYGYQQQYYATAPRQKRQPKLNYQEQPPPLPPEPKTEQSVKKEVQQINRGLSNIAKRNIERHVKNMRPRIWEIIFKAVSTSAAAASISSGKLRIDFGLTTSPVAAIAAAVADTLEIRALQSGGNLLGGLVLKLQSSDYTNLFSLPVAVQTATYSRGGREQQITMPWLYWLLSMGQQIIVSDYGVSYGSKGRTGGGNMNKANAPFKVDSQFAGTQDDNFITRAVQSVVPQIQKILMEGLV